MGHVRLGNCKDHVLRIIHQVVTVVSLATLTLGMSGLLKFKKTKAASSASAGVPPAKCRV
jgi:hypothetical protein